MDIYALSDKAIQEELGNRLKALRLRKNMTQQELHVASALSLNTIKTLESGQGKLSSLIAILRELEALEQLKNFIPDISISPIQLAAMQGKPRQRASKKRKTINKKGESTW